MGEPLYYIQEFTDEVMPCDPTLAGWAAWLAHPNGAPGGYVNGSVFDAFVMERLENVTATMTQHGWVFSREVEPTASFFAETLGGGGWDAETAARSLSDFLQCREEMNGSPFDIGDEVEIAVCLDLPNVRIRFDRTLDGPRCIVLRDVN